MCRTGPMFLLTSWLATEQDPEIPLKEPESSTRPLRKPEGTSLGVQWPRNAPFEKLDTDLISSTVTQLQVHARNIEPTHQVRIPQAAAKTDAASKKVILKRKEAPHPHSVLESTVCKVCSSPQSPCNRYPQCPHLPVRKLRLREVKT